MKLVTIEKKKTHWRFKEKFFFCHIPVEWYLCPKLSLNFSRLSWNNLSSYLKGEWLFVFFHRKKKNNLKSFGNCLLWAWMFNTWSARVSGLFRVWDECVRKCPGTIVSFCFTLIFLSSFGFVNKTKVLEAKSRADWSQIG